MQNPFSKTASEILGRIDEIKLEERAVQEDLQAKKLAKEDAFKKAVALFGRMESNIRTYVTMANDAIGRDDVVLKTKTEGIKKESAGSITISLESSGKVIKSFRFVGNANFKAFIHDLGEPRFGPLDLNSVDDLPYQDAFERFLRETLSALGNRGEANPQA